MTVQKSGLNGRAALVTGASRGIGKGIARRLARDGFTVAVHYNGSAAGAEEAVSLINGDGGSAFALQGNISDVENIKSLYERFDAELASRGLSGLDVLVNNAGVVVDGTIDSYSEEQFDKQINTNLKGGFFMTQHALPRLKSGGRIINLSSGSTRKAMPEVMLYSATKCAIDFMTRALAVQLGPRGITVNALSPGFTETEMTKALYEDNPGMRDMIIGNVALKRIGQIDDISPIASFLASPESEWITGQVLQASGGEFL